MGVLDTEDIPEMASLLAVLGYLRAREPALAVAAVASVADRDEMLGVQRMIDTDAGTAVELPAAYLTAPPTDEVAMFIASTRRSSSSRG